MSEYNALVTDHFFSPRNIGNTPPEGIKVYVVKHGDRALGEYAEVRFCLNDRLDILYFNYKVLGHPYLIAGLSYLSEALKGKPLSKANTFTHEVLTEHLDIPKNKRYCALFLEDVLQDMLRKGRDHDKR